MNSSKKVGNLATDVSVDESIEALITFMCDVLNDTEEYRKILENEYNDCKTELQKNTSSVSHDDYTRIEKLCDKFQTQLNRFSKAFTQDYLDILTVGLELYNLRVEHGSAMKEYDRFDVEDKKFVKKATNLARKIKRIIKKHDKLAVVYNTQIDKLDTFHKHLEKQLIIYTTNYDRKFVIPVKDYIAEFRSVKSDKTTKKKGQIISDHLNDMLKRMSGNGDGSPLIRISKLEDVNFDRNAADERKRKGEDSESDEAKKRNAAESDKPSSNKTRIPRETAGNQYNVQQNVQKSSRPSQIGSLLKSGSRRDNLPNLQRLSPNASQENMEHSDGLELGLASLASKLHPNDRSSSETLTKERYRENRSRNLEGIRENKREERKKISKDNLQNLVMSRRGVPQNLGEESDSDAVNDNQNENSSSLDNSQPDNKNIPPISRLESDVAASDSANSNSYSEGSLESGPPSLASEFESIGETGMINSPHIMDYPEIDDEEIDDSDEASKIDSPVEHLRKEELITDLDPTDESSPKSSTKNRYKGNRSKTLENIRENIREKRKKNSKDKSQDLVVKLRGVKEESGEDSDSDAVNDNQNENSSSSENSEPDNKKIASEKRLESDVTASELQRLQSEDTGSSHSDSTNDSGKLAQKRHLEENEDPYHDVLEYSAPISKKMLVSKRKLKSDVTASDSEGSQSEDKGSSHSDSTNDSVRPLLKRHREKNDDPYHDVLEYSAPISKRKMVSIKKLKSDVTASDSEN
ncbi:GSCOCG00009685001-RA-CDS, partial [Cotesia congregata]